MTLQYKIATAFYIIISTNMPLPTKTPENHKNREAIYKNTEDVHPLRNNRKRTA